MRISFNQPFFIPWGGFFARLMHSDKMVLLDDTLLARGFTYVNRNRIKSPEGEIWISVPLKRKGLGRQKIKDLNIYKKASWAKDFLLTLHHFYCKSLYFNPLFEEIKSAVESPDDRFLPLALDLANIVKNHLGIEQEFLLQSQTGVTGKGTSLLVSLAENLGAEEVILPYFSRNILKWKDFTAKGIAVRFLRFDPPQYPQLWGHFLKRLSALDLLFCCGSQGRKVLERGSYLYEL